MITIKTTSFALLTLLTAGCTSDTTTSPGAADGGGGTSGSGGTGGKGGGTGGKGTSAEASLGTTNLKWKVLPPSDPNSDAPPSGIPGVHVCVDGHAEITCTDSDKDGFFSLKALPNDSDVVLVLEKTGYFPTLKPIETSNVDMDGVQNPIQMTPTTQIPTDLGFTVDTTGAGTVQFFAIGQVQNNTSGFGPLPGATVKLVPAAGKGPIYIRPDGTLDPTLKVAASYGGAFFNVPDGDYKATFTAPPGYDCASISFPFAGWGFPVANEPAVQFPVKKGHVTAGVGVFCTPSSSHLDAGTPDATVPDATVPDATAPDATAPVTDAGPGGAKDGG